MYSLYVVDRRQPNSPRHLGDDLSALDVMTSITHLRRRFADIPLVFVWMRA